MATPVIPARQTIYVEDIEYKKSWSEALGRKIGAAINFISQRLVRVEKINFGGYFKPSSVDEYMTSVYLLKPTKIAAYSMEISVTASGDHKINFSVIDTNGTVLGNLFSTAPNINGSGKVNSVVGRNFNTSSTLERNLPATFDNGTIDAAYLNQTIPNGYSLRPYIQNGSGNAVGCYFTLFLEEQE